MDILTRRIFIIILVVLVLAAAVFAGWKYFVQSAPTVPDNEVSDITWEYDFDDGSWQPSSTPPSCPEPLAFQSPADVSLATSVLYPGQYRGSHYKAHGGLRFDNSQNDDIQVTIPFDAKLVDASRYLESGTVQYLFVFIIPCGISYRIDHPLTLTPKFQEIADALPPAKPNDSRTTRLDPPVEVSVGEVLATAVGHTSPKNVFFDFGVYDLRQRNQVSQDPAWIQEHPNELHQTAFAICWFDLLPEEDTEILLSLPGSDSISGKNSDYCK